MKATIDSDETSAVLTIGLATVDDAARAIDFVKASARILWPDIVFSDEPGFQDDAPQPRKKKKKPMDFSRPPREGSLSSDVLALAKKLKSADVTAIADALDLNTGVAAMTLGRLRRGGHLKAIGL